MYKLLIVDDEPLIRKSLVSTIDYNAIGFSVVDDADNGVSGIDAYKKYKPDVIITDIRMNVLDGLKMIEEINRIDTGNCQFIILSGFNNFEYLKSSISLGVAEYLLKPIKNDELIKVLIKIKEKLDKKHAEQEAISDLNEKLKRLKENYIRRLFVTGISEDEAKKTFDLFSTGSEVDSYYSIYSELGTKNPDIPGTADYNYIICNIENDIYGFIVFNDMNNAFALELSDKNSSAKIGISDMNSEISKISSSIENAYQAYKNCKNGVNIAFGLHDDVQINSLASKAKQYVKENYSQNISTKHVAKQLGFSESHFMLLFKKATGTSFSSYLLEYRMNVAIAMMKTHKYRIYEICSNIGYRDIKSFRNAFKKYTGMSPVDYKKKMEQESGEYEKLYDTKNEDRDI